MRHLLLALLCANLFLAFISDTQAQDKKTKANTDAFGDPLPAGAIARIGTVRFRLTSGRGPESAALSPDGKLIAVLEPDDNIDIFELPAWTRVRRIKGSGLNGANQPQLHGIMFLADSKRLATTDITSGQVFFLDAGTGAVLKKIAVLPKVAPLEPRLYIARDEKILVCDFVNNGGKDSGHQIVVWDLVNNKELHKITVPIDRLNGARANLVVSEDCRWLARHIASDNANRPGRGIESRIEMWNLTTGKSAATVDTEMINPRLALSPDGKWLAAANIDSLLRIYDAATLKEAHNIRGRAGPTYLRFAPNGDLYIGDHDGKVSRWNTATGERLESWKAPHPCSVTQLVFPQAGKVLALGTNVDAVHFWDVPAAKLYSPTGLPGGVVNEVSFSPQGELFVASDDGMTAWWNPRTGAKVRELKLEFDPGDERGRNPNILFDGLARREFDRRRSSSVASLGLNATMSASGEFLINSDGAGNLFFDARTGKMLYEEDSGQDGIIAGDVVFLDGGARCIGMQKKKVRIWNTRTGRDVASYDIALRDTEQASRFSASPAGKRFGIETSDRQGDAPAGRVIVWDAAQKKILREWPAQNGVDSFAFSRDEQWFALARQQARVQLTRLGAARADHELPGAGVNDIDINQCVFSPDSRQLACAAIVLQGNGNGRDQGRVMIYEIFSKKIRLQLNGHAGIVERLGYSHDSALLASGSSDTTTLVWKVGLRACADAPLAEDAPAADLDAWYDQMAGADAKKAFQGMIQLTRARLQTVKFLGDKIAAAKKPASGEKTLKQWIQDLGSGQFAVRTKANQMLLKVGAAAEIELHQALAGANDIETRRRIEELLDRIAQAEWTAADITHARAVEVLDAIGTSEARAVLTRWSAGDVGAILTVEAKKALK